MLVRSFSWFTCATNKTNTKNRESFCAYSRPREACRFNCNHTKTLPHVRKTYYAQYITLKYISYLNTTIYTIYHVTNNFKSLYGKSPLGSLVCDFTNQ